MAICQCGKEHHRSETGPCPACYMKAYKRTKRGKLNVKKANAKHQKKFSKERYKKYGIPYRERTGYFVPDTLWELRLACKTLERALEAAANGTEFRKPSQRCRDASVERTNKYGRSKNLRNLSAGSRASRIS